MSTFNAKVIKITWSEKTSRESVSFKEICKKYSKKDCLYQAYGDSPIYGRDALLYIGKTKNSNKRLDQHLKTDFSKINNLSIVFGIISIEQKEKGWSIEEIASLSEALLITMVKPSHNSFNIKDTNHLLKKNHKFLLLNFGNRGALPLEVSNYWWKDESHDNSVIASISHIPI
jgi:hypothetical protein